jgi:hypothetical protein
MLKEKIGQIKRRENKKNAKKRTKKEKNPEQNR